MQIEQSFLDLKGVRDGAAFCLSLTRKQQRIVILIFLHTIAHSLAWITAKKQPHAYSQ
jgi:hypothetical protein